MKSFGMWMVGLMAALSSSAVLAQGYGTLTGRFVYDGAAPEPKKLEANKDPQVCAKEPLYDEEIVVHKDGSIENLVVQYYVKPLSKPPAADPAVIAKLPPTVRCDNKNCRFTPHISMLVVGKQTLILGNKDGVAHNVAGACLKNSPFNPLIPPNQDLEMKAAAFTKAESLPVPLSCSIHGWMRGRLIVSDHPLVAVTDATGKFTITGIPAGSHTFRAWQENAGYIVTVQRDGKSEEWKFGQFPVTIKAGGTTDLGVVKVAPGNFK